MHRREFISQNHPILQDLAPDKNSIPVAGLHRASPSTTLDELNISYENCDYLYYKKNLCGRQSIFSE